MADWFAWYPVRLWYLHREPESADPMVKALYNGWATTGRWAWLRRVHRVRNFLGQRFCVEIRKATEKQHSHD